VPVCELCGAKGDLIKLAHGTYDAATLGTLLHAKPAEIRDFLAGTLAVDRTRELTEQLRAAGVPV
jgi:hypothetical protein